MGPQHTRGATLREIFDRQLLIGIYAFGGLAMIVATVGVGLLGQYVASAFAAGMFVFGGILLVRYLREGGDHRPYAIALVASAAPMAVVLSLAMGGGIVGSGANPVWGLSSIALATVLVGPQAGLGTLIVWGAATIALAATVPLPDTLPADIVGYTTYNVVGSAISVFVTVGWAIQQRRIVEDELDAERARADRLLAEVLPGAVAERLKRGEVVATHVDDASVLFADVAGFTPMVASLPADRLLPMLDELFRDIDGLVEAHGLEKIKTIGDCYMVAAGVPQPRPDHADAIARFAIALRDRIAGRTFAGQQLEVRVGIHSGPVLAGVVGRTRFLYDLWGDTVNTASRMESSGTPGRIQVTEALAKRLEGRFGLEERGVIDVKGKGPTKTFYLGAQGS